MRNYTGRFATHHYREKSSFLTLRPWVVVGQVHATSSAKPAVVSLQARSKKAQPIYVHDSSSLRHRELLGSVWGRVKAADRSIAFVCGACVGPTHTSVWGVGVSVRVRVYGCLAAVRLSASPVGWPCPVQRCQGRTRGTARTRRGRRGFPWKRTEACRGSPPVEVNVE